jgi:hypothetical protein
MEELMQFTPDSERGGALSKPLTRDNEATTKANRLGRAASALANPIDTGIRCHEESYHRSAACTAIATPAQFSFPLVLWALGRAIVRVMGQRIALTDKRVSALEDRIRNLETLLNGSHAACETSRQEAGHGT